MARADLLRTLQSRLSELHSWYEGALTHHEARSADEIRAASQALLHSWSGGEPDDLVYFWDSINHDLGLALMQPDRHPRFADDLLGVADPSWDIGEVPLVAGLVIVNEARRTAQLKAPTALLKAALLFADAREAQTEWIAHRGLTRCRRPDSRFIEFERNIEVLEKRQERSRLARLGAEAAHGESNNARAWVQSEWLKHRDVYSGNKSAFARDYVGRLRHERSVVVTEKQMREVWLRDTPPAGKRAG